MRAIVEVKTQAPVHVLMDRARHASSTCPLNTRPTHRPTDVTPNFFVKFRHFGHLTQTGKIQILTPSILRVALVLPPYSYSLSPLKTSRVTRVSWLVLPGQVLLLWEITVNVMNNSTNKLAAFCTAGCLCQEVRQVVICLNVGDKRFAHGNRFSDCMVAN